MSRQSSNGSNQAGSKSALISPICMLLAACGGGGGGTFVASTPPPPIAPTPAPTPPPTGLPGGTMVFTYPATHPIDVRTSWLDSPATRNGTYDVIGRLSLTPGNGAATNRTVAAGEFAIATSQPWAQQSTWTQFDHQYTLRTQAGVFPANVTSLSATGQLSSWDINDAVAYRYPDNPYGDTLQLFGQRLGGFAKAADGSEQQLFSYDYSRTDFGGGRVALNPNDSLLSKLVYDVGYSYVAMGDWSWREVDLNGNTVPVTDSGSLLFVNGQLTPPSGIPLSGTATYDARTLLMRSRSGALGIPFTLTADFGLRTIGTRIDQDFASFGLGDPIQGIHVGGSSSFSSNGSFDIPLTGSVNYSNQSVSTPPPSQAATGEMNGAFFGPNAEQVGGTFSLQRSGDQAPLFQDAFVGQQPKP